MRSKKHKKAIVLGGGISGLIHAKVLSDFFEEVVIYEKEAPLCYGENRRSTPHSAHGHILWKRGEDLLNAIFPDFSEDMIARGSYRFNAAEQFDWYHNGLWKIKYKSSINLISQSRSLLEFYLQERTMQTANIRVVFQTRVLEIVCVDDRVVEILLEQGTQRLADTADFYLDTTGSSGKLISKIVGSSGAKSFDVNLTYLSAVFKIPAEMLNDPTGITYVRPRGPDERKGGGILRIERDRWLVTLYGYDGALLEQSAEGFLQAAAELPDGRVYELIKNAVSESEVYCYKVRTVYCRRLNAADFPAHLLVSGDGICRLDPVFGQGITMSCIYADIMRSIFRANVDLSTLQKKYCKAVSEATFVPWQMAKTEDFRYPGIKNERSFLTWLSMRYSDLLFPLIANDAYVCERFLKVINLQCSPIILFSPLIWLKMLKNYLNREK